MSKYLANMLEKPEDTVRLAIDKLEALCGLPGEDLRLLSDSQHLRRKKISQLGLDPDDTTAEELYHSLQAKYASDSRRISRILLPGAGDNLAERYNQAVEFVRQTTGRREIWTARPAALKNLIKQQPPKRLMKLMGYRSIDSMLKREPEAAIITAARLCEAASWQRDFNRLTARLQLPDYVMRSPSLVMAPTAAVSQLPAKTNPMINRLSGAVVILPSDELKTADVLSLALLMLRGLSELGLRITPRQLARSHPLLNWWADNYHLISQHADGNLSFNIYDVADDHIHRRPFANRRQGSAQDHLWRELVSRYHRLSAEIDQLLPGLEKIFNRTADQLTTVKPPLFAAESVEA